MKNILMRFGLVFLIILVLIIFYGGYKGYQLLNVGCGYMAKMLCSLVFVSGIEADMVVHEDIAHPLLQYFSYEVDYKQKSVTAYAPLKLLNRTAVYRPCLGATLNIDPDSTDTHRDLSYCRVGPDSAYLTEIWPSGNRVNLEEEIPQIDNQRLHEVIGDAFREPDSIRLRRTRAVVVVYKGKIIAEKYAAPFNEKTPFLGWSMTKSIINALTGILIQEGRLSLKGSLTVPEWRDEDDPRRTIKIKQLLRMTSGLDFDESYSNPLSDVVVMLYGSHDAASYAAHKPLSHNPGNHWYYSSGTTNIISRIIRHTFNNDYEAYLKFPYQSFFYRIGMYSALMETDPSGTFVGSSFSYATARDWARFGLLYLQDGVWMGERILPEDWVNFSVSQTEISEHGTYGAHFWLRRRASTSQDISEADPLTGMYFASGHDGQYVNILPKYDLVIIRLGLSKTYRDWDQNRFVLNILSAFKNFARLR